MEHPLRGSFSLRMVPGSPGSVPLKHHRMDSRHSTKQAVSSNRQETGGLGWNSVVEHLLSMQETMNPIPSTGGESKQKSYKL